MMMRNVLAVLLFCAIAGEVNADPVVELGTYLVGSGIANTAIPIYGYDDPATTIPANVAPTDPGVFGLNLHVMIGNGDGSAGPVFVLGAAGQGVASPAGANSGYVGPASDPSTGGDTVTGTVFGNLPHFGPADAGLSTSQELFITIALFRPSGFALLSEDPNNPSLLATVYVNAVGVDAGTSWALKIGGDNVNPDVIGADGSGPNYGPLDFDDGGHFNTTLSDGIIEVTPSNSFFTPEPSSIVLACLAAAGLAVTRLRRQR